MASRTQRPQRTLARDLGAVGLMTLGFLLLASLLYADRNTGPLMTFLAAGLRAALGVGAWLVPFVCFAAAVVVGLDNPPQVSRRTMAGAGVIYVVLLAMLHLAKHTASALTVASVQSAGGYLGAGVAVLLARALGDLGAYIILMGAAFTGVILFTGSSWAEFLGAIGSGIIATVQGAGAALGGVASRPVARLRTAAEPATEPRPRKRQPKAAERSRQRGSGIFDPSEDEAGPEAAQAAAVEETQEPTDEQGQLALEEAEVEEAVSDTPQPAQQPPAASRETADEAQQPPRWLLPDIELLQVHKDDLLTDEDEAELQHRVRVLEETLLNFGIPARVRDYEHGPTVTRFEVELEPGIRVSKVTQIQSDLAMAMAVAHVRIEAPIPGKRAVGIEVPNPKRRIVSLRSVIETPEFQDHPSPLAIALGKDVAGRPVVVDLETMPHLLIAGQTGSGKSVCLHTIIVSLLMRSTPDQVRLILIDPKRVEMTRYDGIPHLYSPVVDTTREAADVLRKVIREMRRRYDRFAVAGVADIGEYNRRLAEGDLPEELLADRTPLPRIVIAVDELGELMIQARAEFEQSICTLARLARATGIHIVLATQRPSVNVVTGQIKANFAARIALRLPAQHDSRTILDVVGADKLLGRGDMLLMTSELAKPIRLQGAYVRRGDIQRLVSFLRSQGEPEYKILPELPADDAVDVTEEVDVGDELFEAAVRYVVSEQEASVSMLQRRFKIGYARAGRLIDLMERRGIVGPHEGSRPRRVLVGMHNLDDVLRGVRPASPVEEFAGPPSRDHDETAPGES